jgi:hypothetical protein
VRGQPRRGRRQRRRPLVLAGHLVGDLAAQDLHVVRGLDPEAHAAPVAGDHDDADVSVDQDGIANASSQDEHGLRSAA